MMSRKNGSKRCLSRTGALASLVSVLACCSLPALPPAGVEELIPLQAGNTWVFKTTFFDPDGAEIDTAVDSIVLAADTLVAGVEWAVRPYFGHLLAYRNAQAGVCIRLVSAHTAAARALQYKYPARPAVRFDYPLVFFAADSAWLDSSVQVATVIATDTLVSVPAGRFVCYGYRVLDLRIGLWKDEFIAPGYGWVKTDWYSKEHSNRPVFKVNTQELVRYRIGGK